MYEPDKIFAQLEVFGIEAMSHSGSSLKSHLVGTCSILEKWQQDSYLCLAGLCHSVYGTESYSGQTVPLNMRSRLAKMIGDESESLV